MTEEESRMGLMKATNPKDAVGTAMLPSGKMVLMPTSPKLDPNVDGFPEASEAELAYAAGLIDGEGRIGIYYNSHNGNYQLRITVEMSDSAGINLLYDLFGGKFYDRQREGNRKSTKSWMVFNSRAEYVLTQLRPYLRVKYKQAEASLKCDWSSFKGGKLLSEDALGDREQVHCTLKILNKRGINE